MRKTPERIPIWLRRLDRVAKELREERPSSAPAEERIEAALSLMAEGLACLYERVGKIPRGRRKAVIGVRVQEQMARFHSLDADWIRRWRGERDRTFGR
jgi:hypothetical protein